MNKQILKFHSPLNLVNLRNIYPPKLLTHHFEQMELMLTLRQMLQNTFDLSPYERKELRACYQEDLL